MPLDVGELRARLTLDDDRFIQATRRDEQLMDQLRRGALDMGRGVEGSMRDATRQAGRLGDSADSARRDLGRVGDTSRDIDRVADSARRSEREVGRLGEAAERAGSGMSSLAGSLSERAGSSGGAGFLSGFSGQISGLAGKGGPIGMALVGVAALGVAAGAVLAQAIADGMEQERVRDRIQAQLGIGEEAAEDIGRAAGAAYSNGWGESVETNMDAARAAIQSGLLTGEEDTATFAHTIERLNMIADLMGEEVPAVARAAGQAIKTDLAGNAEEAFDFLAASQRNSLNVSEDLLDSFNEYSTQLRALGLEGAEGWALVSQGVQAGARDTDVVIDALKEFKLRATDGTAAAADGFEALKVPAEDFRLAMNQGGQASRDMMATMLRNLGEIEDPILKNEAALALFGTKFEDIQEAAFALNLDTAVKQFGQVEGSAAKMADTMQSNTAASFDQARRSIEVSLDAVNLALAEAFGPELTKISDWVATHKPEIMGFFFDLADGALLAGEGIARFVSGALHVIGPFSAITAEAFGGTLRTMGMFVDAAATVADALGMDGMAESLRSASGFLDEYGTKAHENSGALIELARSIDNDVVPALSGMREGLRESGEQAVAAETMMRALGDTVVTGVPDDKTITIEDNSPEAIKRLEDLGFKVENTPNGITVTAETAEADSIITGFINRERELDVKVRIHYDNLQAQNDAIVSSASAAAQRQAETGQYQRVHYADGGIRDPQIQPGRGRGIVWAEQETVKESYIPWAESKRGRAEKILAATAEHFGLGLVKMADGGIVGPAGFNAQAAIDRAKAKDGRAYGYATLDDCSGHLSDVFNAGTGQSVRFNTASDFGSMGWAQGYDPNGFSIGTNGGVGMDGHMAGTLYGVNIESDGSNGVQYGGSADGAQDFPQVWHWPGATMGDDPSTERRGMAGPDRDLAATFNEQNDPDGMRALTEAGDFTGRFAKAYGVHEDSELVDRLINTKRDGYAAGTTDSGTMLSTDGQRVFVTNWPGTLGGSTAAEKPADERKPILTASMRVFENGGLRAPQEALIAPDGAELVHFAEKGTGGEGYVPLAPSKRGRSVAITREIARRFGFELVPMADGGLTGFGGYIGDQGPTFDVPLTPEGWAGMSANKRRATMASLAGLGIGGAFALASGFDENGRFTGQFDTGANSHPALEKGFQALVEKLEEIRKAAQNPDPVDVQVDIDSGSRTAQVEITKRGL